MTETSNDLTALERNRYSRHLLLPEVGIDGQKRLKSAKVLVIGAGGLGSPAILYLAAAGIGTIGIVDHDSVELSNLQRQVLYGVDQVGQPKVTCAANRAANLNPEINIETHAVRFAVDNALDLVAAYDIVIDGTDNFATRYLANDACVFRGKPYIYGAIYRFEGQVSVFNYKGGPCYRCLFPDPPSADAVPNCAEGGVLGVLAGTIGVWQATEALKIILELGTTLSGTLMIYDPLSAGVETLKLKRNPTCPVCGDTPTIVSLSDTVVSCSSPATAMLPVPELSVVELQARLGSPAKHPTLLDVRTVQEYSLSHLAGSKHIPVNDLVERLGELNAGEEYVVYCRSGMRSAKAVGILAQHGFSRLTSLRGGLQAWHNEIDSTICV